MNAYMEALTMFTNNITDHPYLPNVDESVWILGKDRSSLYDRDDIAEDIRSRLWFTYRRGFTPIGNEKGPTTDTGWGCMHRCGQMLIGQAMLHLHLGRDWRWNPNCLDQPYLRILKMFEDKPSACYSIHAIASKAVSDGSRSINSWLGPNTVAQILRKLSVNDSWTKLVVHVTSEDGIVVEEIKNLSRQGVSSQNHLNLSADEAACDKTTPPTAIPELFSYSAERKTIDRTVCVSDSIIRELDDDCVEIVFPPMYNRSEKLSGSPLGYGLPTTEASRTDAYIISTASASSTWHPLLLILPLRLGLHEFNLRYAPALQGLFKLPQCVGVVGGRPNHALWLIGSVGNNEVLCLDPHTTQPAAMLGNPLPGSGEEAGSLDDSFHCNVPIRLPLRRLDPSLAVGFVCPTEADFDSLCTRLLAEHLSPTLFEIHEVRPRNLPPPSFASIRTPEEWSDLCSAPASIPPSSPTPMIPSYKADGDFELV